MKRFLYRKEPSWTFAGFKRLFQTCSARGERLTHAVATGPARPTLRAEFPTDEEVVPGPPRAVVAALAVLKYAAA